jgi:hypothetical protein
MALQLRKQRFADDWVIGMERFTPIKKFLQITSATPAQNIGDLFLAHTKRKTEMVRNGWTDIHLNLFVYSGICSSIS